MSTKDLLLIDGTIISHNSIKDHQDILISNRKIKSISSHKQSKYSSFQTIKKIHLDGAYVLPGFIDSHVHLVLNGFDDIISYVTKNSERTMSANAEKNYKKYIEKGITTIGDMGDFASITNKLKKGSIQNEQWPNIVNTGHMITSPTGHVKTISKRFDNPDQLNNIIQEQIEQGCDMIKLIISGGLLTKDSSPHFSEMCQDEIMKATRITRSYSKPVAAHTYSDNDIKTCIDAGIDRVEHGIFATSKTMKKASKNNIIFTPTLKAVHDLLDHQEILPDYIVNNAQSVKEQIPEFMKNMITNKVKISMGSDAGTPYNYHGKNLKELLLLSKYGLSNWDCINAATTIAAEKLAKQYEIGSIKEQMRADFVVFEKNPIDNISNVMEKPVFVIKNGIKIDEKEKNNYSNVS